MDDHVVFDLAHAAIDRLDEIKTSIDNLTEAVTKLGDGLKINAAASVGGMLAEMITKAASSVPMPDVFAGGTEVDPTEVPPFPPESLCKCMHASGTHLQGDGPCLYGSHANGDLPCSCTNFSHMVAPKPTEGRCLGCFCTPAQVTVGEDGFCANCKKTRELFPAATPKETP